MQPDYGMLATIEKKQSLGSYVHDSAKKTLPVKARNWNGAFR